jgi:serine/threonine protein kinase
MTDSSSSLGSDGRTGRRAKRSGKQKVSSFADEVPNFIDEVIPGTEPVQTIRYVVGEVLGKGAAATVYKGKNAATGEIVAIKKIYKGGMRTEQLKIFLKAVETEFNLMRGLDHPNIVAMKGRVEDPANIYIILEYVNGGSLATYLGKYGTFSPEIAAAQMKQVLQGLDYLHEKGIVHRDIKAANLLITKSGVVKLADFGVSAQLENAEKRYSVVGTPYWMAPEVISMTGHTGRSDIWSLGCTLLELITGHPPYWDLDQMRAVFCIVQDDRPPIPADITGDLYRFLHRCFIKDPEKRASARELLSHPFILNAKLPQTSPSGKLDAKGLKQNLKAYHGNQEPETPPSSNRSSVASDSSFSAPGSSKSPRGGFASASSSASPDHVVIPLNMTGIQPSAAASPISPRNVAQVKNAISSEPDPHAPVPSLQKYDESTSLIQSKEKYTAESGDNENSPCCNIL